MDRIKLDRLLAILDLRARKHPGSPERELAVDTPVIGARDLCWCGQPTGHDHRKRCTCHVRSNAVGPHTRGCPLHPEYGR